MLIIFVHFVNFIILFKFLITFIKFYEHFFVHYVILSESLAFAGKSGGFCQNRDSFDNKSAKIRKRGSPQICQRIFVDNTRNTLAHRPIKH